MRFLSIVLCCAALMSARVGEVSGANILALLTLVSYSHHLWNRELLLALAKRGHNITVISPDSEDTPVANITNIITEGTHEHIEKQAGFEGSTSDSVVYKARMLNMWSVMICDYQMTTTGAKQLFDYPDGRMFDLIIAEVEWAQCFWPFISKFGNPPVVGVCGTGVPRRASFMTASPKIPSFTPDYLVPYSDSMTFLQRAHSWYADLTSTWMWDHEYLPGMQAVADKYFDFPVPDIGEYERNFSLILTNTLFGYDVPRPLAPNLIPVGGMHLRPARPLNKNLQEFLDGAKDGAIFFALGSNVKSAKLPAHVLQAFVEAFAELPLRVLWKFEADTLKNKPANVMISKWLPQRDILGHKNIKIFITHNGLYSSQEAIYFGVPTIGIPFFMDQHKNMERARTLGIGIGLTIDNVSKETLLQSIKEILTNPSYAENTRRLSALFHDQKEHSLERAVYWTEYVLRHKGAPHLRSVAVDMPMYQYLMLDIVAVAVVAVVVALLLLKAVLRSLWRHLTPLRAAISKAKTD